MRHLIRIETDDSSGKMQDGGGAPKVSKLFRVRSWRQDGYRVGSGMVFIGAAFRRSIPRFPSLTQLFAVKLRFRSASLAPGRKNRTPSPAKPAPRKCRKICGLLLGSVLSASGQTTRWADPGLPVKDGLALWLDATRENEAREAHYMNRLADGDRAELWHDSSGHDRHLMQWTASARPAWQAGSFEFDGNDYLAALATPGLSVQEATLLVVAFVPAAGGDFPALLSAARRGENDFTSAVCVDFGRAAAPPDVINYLNVEGAGQLREANTLTTPLASRAGHVFAISIGAGETTVRVDGQAQGRRERTDAALAVDRIAVGARFVAPEMRHFLKGRIAELLLFSRRLDAPQLARVEEYLTKKHADFLANPARQGAPARQESRAAVQMLVPGFTVRELPVRTTNLNNIAYAPDSRLFAAGYDGRFHLLRDTDRDGVEDEVNTFEPKTSDDYPLGMVIKDGMPHALLSDEIVRYRDTNGDGIPDRRESVAKGWDDPELRASPLLMHRRVDSAMALAAGPDDDWYVTMGSANPGNGYWQQAEGDPFAAGAVKTGRAVYSPDKRRGCLLHLDRHGRVTQLNSGLRYIMSLQWDRHGELFGTDQEGATWLPNGNPFDELLHLQKGRHYGFPPRHPQLLPEVTDEPSVWDYAPQHQSACGFRFNGPAKDRAVFGPEFWSHDAIVTGQARGKLWRTKLVKTPAGYVAMNQLFACLGMLVTDCAISPGGELVICCHSGDPDWGSGPNGAGRLFKIRYADRSVPQPVLTWAASETETVVAFDKPLPASAGTGFLPAITVEAGRFVEAGDRFEKMRPGYAVVQAQQREKRAPVAVQRAALSADRSSLRIETAPRTTAVRYALTFQQPGQDMDLAHDLHGVQGEWAGAAGTPAAPRLWLPHPDFTAARELTAGSTAHAAFWKQLAVRGELTLRGQLDLWKMLTPLTQPGSRLDYIPEPEVVTVVFKSDAALKLYAPGAKLEQTAQGEARLTVTPGGEGKWLPFTLSLATPATSLGISFHTTRDPRPRALAGKRFLLPFAVPPAPLENTPPPPEIAGGDWNAGRALYHGKAICATCHSLRGEGSRVGPDLDNLIHRDYASVLADIVNPNAAINPDAVAYSATLRDGTAAAGTRIKDTADELHLALPGGTVSKLKKTDLVKTEPLAVSLMPPGLDKTLTATELRDLMTYLLIESPPGR